MAHGMAPAPAGARRRESAAPALPVHHPAVFLPAALPREGHLAFWDPDRCLGPRRLQRAVCRAHPADRGPP